MAGVKKCSYFGKFGGLRFVVTSVLGSVLLPCYQHMYKIVSKSQTQPAITYSKLTIETLERRSGVLIVNFEHISHLALVFLLLTSGR